MLVYQFQGKSALWGGGAGTVRGARGTLIGQGPVFHLACLVLLIHARALHQDLCHTSQCPPGLTLLRVHSPFTWTSTLA